MVLEKLVVMVIDRVCSKVPWAEMGTHMKMQLLRHS